MKKSLCTSIAIIVMSLFSTVYASERSTAVLQSGSNSKIFYGDSAFCKAAEAAKTGDLISLSRGKFSCPATITKAVKIQGSGVNTILTTHDRVLKFDLNSDQKGLHLEGFKMDGTYKEISITGYANNVTIQHYDGAITISGAIDVCEIAQCNISTLRTNESGSGLYVHNCIIGSDGVMCDAVLDRTIIKRFYSNYGSHKNHSIKNSIIAGTSSKESVGASSLLKFINVVVNGNISINENLYQENVTVLPNSEINALFTSTTTYELTDTAAEQYQSDGSQLGAYGGTTPYTTVPAIPAVTSVKVPSTVAHDGNLQVSFNVEVNK